MSRLIAWRRFRVRLWVAVERRVRVAYDELVDAEAKAQVNAAPEVEKAEGRAA